MLNLYTPDLSRVLTIRYSNMLQTGCASQRHTDQGHYRRLRRIHEQTCSFRPARPDRGLFFVVVLFCSDNISGTSRLVHSAHTGRVQRQSQDDSQSSRDRTHNPLPLFDASKPDRKSPVKFFALPASTATCMSSESQIRKPFGGADSSSGPGS